MGMRVCDWCDGRAVASTLRTVTVTLPPPGYQGKLTYPRVEVVRACAKHRRYLGMPPRPKPQPQEM